MPYDIPTQTAAFKNIFWDIESANQVVDPYKDWMAKWQAEKDALAVMGPNSNDIEALDNLKRDMLIWLYEERDRICQDEARLTQVLNDQSDRIERYDDESDLEPRRLVYLGRLRAKIGGFRKLQEEGLLFSDATWHGSTTTLTMAEPLETLEIEHWNGSTETLGYAGAQETGTTTTEEPQTDNTTAPESSRGVSTDDQRDGGRLRNLGRRMFGRGRS